MENNWRQNKATAGGGALMDMGIHCIDLIQYITGLEVEQITGMIGNQIFKYNVEDAGVVLLKMNNGAICCIDSNFNIPDEAAKCRLEFYGTKGSIMAEGTISQIESGMAEIIVINDSSTYDAAQERNVIGFKKIEAELSNMYTKEIEAFGNSILYNTTVPVPAKEAIINQKIVEAVYQSQKNINIHI